MTHLKSQPMLPPTCPQLLQKIVTALFPQQRKFNYLKTQDKLEDIPSVTQEELKEACNRWKQQRLVLLPKGKKPPEEPSSYRPLCMLDTATTEAIAGTRWKGGTKKYCLVATLDIRNAFNSSNWECIMQAFREKNVPEYLCKIVASNFTDRILKYDTKNGPRKYNISGGVPQGSVFGPLLWNIMYDGLLRLRLPRSVKLVAYADDAAVVIVAKLLDDINHMAGIAFEQVNRWMNTVNLQLAHHKTEAVLITSKKNLEMITLEVGEQRINRIER
ncbi:Putative 115 kDa protein in type-1 retrotransposable element R1DM [Eumeta japonica]|uniref:115 kDa protein in type-1 retrotransposable element R1DM n=1 Tax=Eumeta variegata TaxID=151549 RepID=A0A4C1X4S7_EUMVA|nr:Putative 115 kDa protein in type-1 retrotransposable element R1DM [Eumeta japonica]